MRYCIIRATLTSLLIVVSFDSGFSQSAQTGPRPKVGLVLEGGGALGLAHIGVIQWLEEHRIPVNYVAGTSMGGLVGGIYVRVVQPQKSKSWSGPSTGTRYCKVKLLTRIFLFAASRMPRNIPII